MKSQCYKVTLRENINGGEIETFVYAGCLEEAEQKAIKSFEEYFDKEDLKVINCVASEEGIKWDGE